MTKMMQMMVSKLCGPLHCYDGDSDTYRIIGPKASGRNRMSMMIDDLNTQPQGLSMLWWDLPSCYAMRR